MIRDPLYRDILSGLDGRLDPELFEQCSVDLLRREAFPTLVPIRGGADAGMDGAIADGEGLAYPLVCTTGTDVIGNLTRSLNSYIGDGGSRHLVVVATSQALSQRRRRNLEKRATQKGFQLVQVYDKHALADLLYHDPDWCRELLNLVGTPSALSVMPPNRRPLLGEALVGREDDLEWLRQSDGDRLLLGSTGSGKSFLLRKFALEGEALFVASSDRTEIANALRRQEPRTVIVDDAHLNPEQVRDLLYLRDEMGRQFSILASGWRGDESDEIADFLNLTHSDIRDLQLLTRDEIVTVIENCGMYSPVELVREIVDQAEGRPGLAVTLVYLCLRGGIREVALGEALKRTTVGTFRRLVGDETTQILAAFALGGDAGMPSGVVARVLEIPVYRLHSALVQLTAGGIIDEPRYVVQGYVTDQETHNQQPHLSVRPPSLRYVLVKDLFFGSALRLPYEELIDAAPEVSEVAQVLVRAAAYGASIPPGLLVEILERAHSTEAWTEYVTLGETEASWVLTNHPELTVAVAEAALFRVPRMIIPKLLNLAVEDERPLNPFPDHPLRILQGWIRAAVPGTNQAIRRRDSLVEAAKDWLYENGDERIGLHALRMAMSPGFDAYVADPGSGMTVTLRRGLLRPNELSELQQLWTRVLDTVETLRTVAWDQLLEILWDWMYPSLHTGQEPPEEVGDRMRSFAKEMLADVLRLANHHPGVMHKAADYAERLDSDLDVELDPEFETLFPAERLQESSLNYSARQARQQAAVRELASTWATREPSTIAQRIGVLEAAAADVNINHPRYTPLLCEELSERVERPSRWLRALLHEQARSDLLTPFLAKAAAAGVEGWEELASGMLEDSDRRSAAVSVVLTTPDPPEELLDDVLNHLSGFSLAIDMYVRRGEIPSGTLASLLRHDDAEIAAGAAVGEWYAAPEGEVREELSDDWRAAILRTHTEHYAVDEILESNPEIAHDWLRRHVEEGVITSIDANDSVVGSAISVLNRPQRLSVLRSVSPTSMDTALVRNLVGNDLDLYREFLQDDNLTLVHLWPLTDRPTGLWSEKAKLAMNAGFSAKDVAGAAYSGVMSWTGSESAMWRGWIEQWRPLCSHPDGGVRSAAEYGLQYAQQREQEAAEQERQEDIYGR